MKEKKIAPETSGACNLFNLTWPDKVNQCNLDKRTLTVFVAVSPSKTTKNEKENHQHARHCSHGSTSCGRETQLYPMPSVTDASRAGENIVTSLEPSRASR
ncbi:hypothetical protein BaRGS_00018432 [Batillaria attramentaria]|uniref:Uncharacterized protein n=1 Tax=Batillaria attramentaria TaxID=370345 RepID=A0ABD0KSN0_9CAEN